jgi:glycosyltransferase involved in cell wall biosynthesis
MILLSCVEAHPFVCLEGMAAGIGLVLSEQSTANLDISQPFITVIPDNKINDIAYLKEKIEENRKISLNMRKKIRQYCFDNFDWSVIIDKYLLTIEKLN